MMEMAPLSSSVHQWRARALEHGTKQSSMFAVAIPFIVIIISVAVGLRVHPCEIEPGQGQTGYR